MQYFFASSFQARHLFAARRHVLKALPQTYCSNLGARTIPAHFLFNLAASGAFVFYFFFFVISRSFIAQFLFLAVFFNALLAFESTWKKIKTKPRTTNLAAEMAACTKILVPTFLKLGSQAVTLALVLGNISKIWGKQFSRNSFALSPWAVTLSRCLLLRVNSHQTKLESCVSCSDCDRPCASCSWINSLTSESESVRDAYFEYLILLTGGKACVHAISIYACAAGENKMHPYRAMKAATPAFLTRSLGCSVNMYSLLYI